MLPKVRSRFLAIVAVFVLSGGGLVKAQTPTRENIEWANFWWENTNDTKLPRVLLIGDSISVGYRGLVTQKLKGKANVDHLATSKAIDDPALLKETEYAIEGYKHAVIHFNNGLHGGHVTDNAYEKCLREYVRKLREWAPDAKLIWASTTPYPSSKPGVTLDEKRNAVVLARNAIAEKIMKENNISINDLYALMVGDLDNLTASKGNVHYNEKGKAMQGEAVAKRILEVME